MEYAIFVFFSVGFFLIGYNLGATTGYQKGIEDYKEHVEPKHIRY